MTKPQATILALLESRAPGATICPSEAARKLAEDGADGWRTLMPAVHDATDALLDEGRIAISWKGRSLARRDGPYRIARPRA